MVGTDDLAATGDPIRDVTHEPPTVTRPGASTVDDGALRYRVRRDYPFEPAVGGVGGPDRPPIGVSGGTDRW